MLYRTPTDAITIAGLRYGRLPMHYAAPWVRQYSLQLQISRPETATRVFALWCRASEPLLMIVLKCLPHLSVLKMSNPVHRRSECGQDLAFLVVKSGTSPRAPRNSETVIHPGHYPSCVGSQSCRVTILYLLSSKRALSRICRCISGNSPSL
jgi:hypothetical protein